MKTFAVGLLVVLIAGCSSMGMGMKSMGGMGGYSSDSMHSGPSGNNSVIDPATGNLTLYHGG